MSGSEEKSGTVPAESRWRAALITFFPMLIAVLSLVTSIYNGYLNNKFVTLIQGNLSRAEYLRTCRDTIDAYFQVKYRAEVVSRQGAVAADAGSGRSSAADVEAGNAVAKFGALATYLANLRDEKVRASYTELYWKLDKYVGIAASASKTERDKVIGEADAIFATLNDDCVKSAGQRL